MLKINDAWGLGFCKGSEGLRAKMSLVGGRIVYVRGSEDWFHRYKMHYRVHAAMRPALAKEMRINLGINDEGKDTTGKLAKVHGDYIVIRRSNDISKALARERTLDLCDLMEVEIPKVQEYEMTMSKESLSWWKEREEKAEKRWVGSRRGGVEAFACALLRPFLLCSAPLLLPKRSPQTKPNQHPAPPAQTLPLAPTSLPCRRPTQRTRRGSRGSSNSASGSWPTVTTRRGSSSSTAWR